MRASSPRRHPPTLPLTLTGLCACAEVNLGGGGAAGGGAWEGCGDTGLAGPSGVDQGLGCLFRDEETQAREFLLWLSGKEPN